MTGRTEEDRVVVLDLVAAVLGHHAAMFLVELAAPIEAVEFEGEAAVARGERPQDLDARVDHLRADAVARNSGDPVGLHSSFSPAPARTCER